MSEEEIDICSREGFKKFLEENPKVLLLVTGKDCSLCPTLREAAYKVGEEKEVGVAEMEFKPGAAGQCQVLDEDLKVGAELGVAVYFKEGKEVGRRKAYGDIKFDEERVKELIEKEK